ncbi:E3 ubiquitin-protein ligase HERC2 [Vitis vinifera]|uniref:E3 ubiquitin-protein ligase HERC2 n=1 Tax=Vitis vinifera TaxID=29760 RepID=A0A438C243_VITVI|nr:E3 ubiquitin-protein ligase HERC2 [Vitis vinifera]
MEDAGTVPESGNLRGKIVSVAAGEAHSLVLTGDGRVYSWGRGTFGRLGTGSGADELFPVPIKFDSAEKSDSKGVKFVGIAAGAYHSVALAEFVVSIQLYDLKMMEQFGAGVTIAVSSIMVMFILDCYMDGQLGFSDDNCLVPHLLEMFLGLGSLGSLTDESDMKNKTPLKVNAVKAGGMMSLAIDNLGGLWMWGNVPESSPDKGEFSLVSSFTPIPVWDFHGHTVVKVACGNEHVVALVSHGETYKGGDLICYSWGNNGHGQLGLGDTENRLRPEVVKTFNHESLWEVYEVACGAFHTALLTHKKRPSDTLEISSAGEVWSWGMEKGLGLCPDASFTGTDPGDAPSPLSYGSKFRDPVQGKEWVLGNGKTVDCFAPSTVLWPPLTEDFKELESGTTSGEKKIENKDPEEVTEMEKRLSLATEEMKLLHSKLSTMERYASILHGSIFGKPFEEQDIPISLQNSGFFDIAKEWENMLESADRGKLVMLEKFYRNMLAGVKDKLMKRRIQEIIKECLPPPATGN